MCAFWGGVGSILCFMHTYLFRNTCGRGVFFLKWKSKIYVGKIKSSLLARIYSV